MQGTKDSVPETIDNLRRVFQAINEYSKSAERSTGLTGPQLWALKILFIESPMRVSDLARQMRLRPPTVVGIIDRLEGKGLIFRKISKEDRRAVNLGLEETGRNLAARAPEVVQDILLRGLEELTEEQRQSVAEGMKLLVQLLGAEQIIPQPLRS
jgi:DNA-binding MarR family transcriptional regulator